MNNNNSVDLANGIEINYDPFDKKIFYQEQNKSACNCSHVKAKVCDSAKIVTKSLSNPSLYKNFLFTRIPFLQWFFFEYKIKKSLIHDLIAGVTIGIMSMPQCMGISLLANLPPVHGLYMSFFPIFMYLIFGTSKHLVVGAISVVGLISGEVIQDMSDEYSSSLMQQNFTKNMTNGLINDYKVSVACTLALFVGIVQFIMGLTGLGMINLYFSEPFVSGYTCGSAIHSILAQCKELLGLSNAKRYRGAFKIPKTVYNLATNIPTANVGTLITSAFSILFLVGFKEFLNPKIKKKFKYEFPSELFLVVIATLSSYFGNFEDNFQINVVKEIPSGLPQPRVPDLLLWTKFIQSGVITALISFSISMSLTSLYASKNKYKVNSTQELFAYGATNVFSSFFSCFPSAGSLSRTSIMNNCGGKSQIASLFSALIILVVILWLGPLFESLPKACLASVMVVALKGLAMQITDFFQFFKVNKYEAISWMATFLSVVLLDVDIGLFVGLGVSILLITTRDQKIEIVRMAKFKEKSPFIDEDLIKINNSNNNSDINILKIQSSLYFVNINAFKIKLKNMLETCDKNSKLSNNSIKTDSAQNDILLTETNKSEFGNFLFRKFVILDFSAVNYIDSAGFKILLETVEDYKKLNVFICICQCQKNFIDSINKMKLVEKFENYLFFSFDDAFNYIKTTGYHGHEEKI